MDSFGRHAEYFRSVVGLEEKDLVGKSAYVLEAEQLIKPVLATKVIATKAPVTEISNLRGNYQNIGEAFPLFDENGKIKEILSYSRDMVFETEVSKKYMKLLSEIDLMKLNDEDSQENWSIVGEGLKTYNNNFRINYVFSQEVLDAFMDYGWPGNLRELENIIHSMILTSSSEFLERDDHD